ncbi:hypothetical protein BOTBODRAFT_190901 [Botryobasidium botryosum FD-172 SS1]|uniref:HAT C-terminal dimerisation domain-containing protein n=1 Tax=Botryobasidium botryosum (strain FD-172 SS1) TaxID=930990 RepID=A0A067M1P9_BOTB1|nr:hypothetical protein BOTBODRAFT_190901 [Botryobasidium botryosum FD-172 SS1]
MAIDYLSIPTTSVDVERAFSYGRQTVLVYRHSLSSESVRASIVFGDHCKEGLVNDDELIALLSEKAMRGKKPESEDEDGEGGSGEDSEDAAGMEVEDDEYTIEMLDFGIAFNLECAASAFNYYNTLMRYTYEDLQGEASNRYDNFRVVSRLWRELRAAMISGAAFGIQQKLPTHFSDNANRPGTEDCAQRYINDLELSIDGNFRLQLKKKKGEPTDFHLRDGLGYFRASEKYKEYIDSVLTTVDIQTSTCHGFKAGDILREGKFKDVIVSGLVSVVCARHGFFWPQGSVDLQKGERYANTDFALAGVLAKCTKIPGIRISYDIACQYSRNFEKRYAANFSDLAFLHDRIRWVVPKLHVFAHTEICQHIHSLNFMDGSGRTHGEVTEQNWSRLNKASTSTREMSSAHRHESLEDNMGGMNRGKMHAMPKTLKKSLKLAIRERDSHKAAFAKLTSATDPDLITKWDAMKREPYRLPKGKFYSVYWMDNSLIPTIDQAADQMTAELASALEERKPACGADRNEATFIQEGVDLQTLQSIDRDSIEAHMQAAAARAHLSERLTAWIKIFSDHMPQVSLKQATVGEAPEDYDIILPSAFPAEQRDTLGLTQLAGHELKMRLSQARDALLDLRVSIQRFSIAVDEKRGARSEKGQKATTRAENQIRRLQQDVQRAAKHYRSIYKLLLSLGLSPSDPRFQPLENADTSGSRRIWRELALRQGRIKVPWIWTAPVGFDTTSSLEWHREANRVQWHRAEANMLRWTEEVVKLKAEINRARTYYEFYADLWGNMTQSTPESRLDHGGNAFCRKQQSMYQRLARACNEAEVSEEKEGPEGVGDSILAKY